MYAVILAGGSGTRLWPWSREQFPKQFLKIKKQSLFQETILRLNNLIPYQKMIIVTHKDQKVFLELQLKEIKEKNGVFFLEEPIAKNTAPAIGLAAYYLFNKDPESIMTVLPSDHIIELQDEYIRLLSRAGKIAEKHGFVTFGIKPNRPETGYGYICHGDVCADDAFWVERFVEKPNLNRAVEFLADGRYLWNSGMYVFKVSDLVKAFEKYLPNLAKMLAQIDYDTFHNMYGIYNQMDSISIDYGIMEKSDKVTVIPADIQWSDVGGWDALYQVLPKDHNGNHIIGKVHTLDAQNSLLITEKRVMGVIGLENIILVDTEDALLACSMNRVQDVKKIVESLKEKDAEVCKLHKTVNRPWGSYTVLEEKSDYKVKHMVIHPKAKISLQYHKHRSEHWIVVSGLARVIMEEKVFLLCKNQSTYIPILAKHRIENPGDEVLEIIEVQNGDYLGEDDIVRLDDDYQRAKCITEDEAGQDLWMQRYQEWLRYPALHEETRLSLRLLSEFEIKERFMKELEFGTGGLRGRMGVGSNRMNTYIVRKATQGIANFINNNYVNGINAMVIAYDSRCLSREFAEEAALVLAANGIRTYVFEDIRTTPELSYAIRKLHCTGGIVITASHNPPEYNGYKVYWSDGGQVVPQISNQLMQEINKVHLFYDVKIVSKEAAQNNGLWIYIGEEMDSEYLAAVKSLSIYEGKQQNALKIVYTPLHGTGNIPIRRVLKSLGYEKIYLVDKQLQPDGRFPTVTVPNPENPDTFDLAIALAETVEADIILGTDPDCDRVGIVVRNDAGKYVMLTGNQTGALLLEYVLHTLNQKNKLPDNGVFVKTIVTSELGRVIASHFGLETVETLTGFKYIGEKINEFEQSNDKKFVFGMEESYGYLTGTFVRDKDAVIASVLIADMAAHYKEKGLTLHQALHLLYHKYGFYKEDMVSLNYTDTSDSEKIKLLMQLFNDELPVEIAGLRIIEKRDYTLGKRFDLIKKQTYNLDLPRADVIYYQLEDHSWFCIRPSGTEPKVKLYFSVNGKSQIEVETKLKELKSSILILTNQITLDEVAAAAEL